MSIYVPHKSNSYQYPLRKTTSISSVSQSLSKSFLLNEVQLLIYFEHASQRFLFGWYFVSATATAPPVRRSTDAQTVTSQYAWYDVITSPTSASR